jgi:hypothetical protein
LLRRPLPPISAATSAAATNARTINVSRESAPADRCARRRATVS